MIASAPVTARLPVGDAPPRDEAQQVAEQDEEEERHDERRELLAAMPDVGDGDVVPHPQHRRLDRAGEAASGALPVFRCLLRAAAREPHDQEHQHRRQHHEVRRAWWARGSSVSGPRWTSGQRGRWICEERVEVEDCQASPVWCSTISPMLTGSFGMQLIIVASCAAPERAGVRAPRDIPAPWASGRNSRRQFAPPPPRTGPRPPSRSAIPYSHPFGNGDSGVRRPARR